MVNRFASNSKGMMWSQRDDAITKQLVVSIPILGTLLAMPQTQESTIQNEQDIYTLLEPQWGFLILSDIGNGPCYMVSDSDDLSEGATVMHNSIGRHKASVEAVRDAMGQLCPCHLLKALCIQNKKERSALCRCHD